MVDPTAMEEMQISKFKATCLAVLDRVGRTRKPVLVIRFGKPIAQVVPPPLGRAGDWLGAMKHHGEINGDLIAPVANLSEWEALDWMGLLLDTHIWLWSLLNPERLSEAVKRALRTPEGELRRFADPRCRLAWPLAWHDRRLSRQVIRQ